MNYMQFLLDENRDLLVDATGNMVPTDNDALQTVIGEVRVIEGDYLFDQTLGIDYKLLASLGDSPTTRDFLKQEVLRKCTEHNLPVKGVDIKNIAGKYEITIDTVANIEPITLIV